VRALVVCLGNELVGDDGVGIRVGRVLGRMPMPEGVEVRIRPNLGLELIELIVEYEQVILVDAMTTGRRGGECAVIELAEASALASCPSCSHSIGVPEVLRLAEALQPGRAKAGVWIVGVEGIEMTEFGLGLSEPVARGMIEAVDRVLAAVGATQEQRRAGRVLAEEEATVKPTMAEVLATGGEKGA